MPTVSNAETRFIQINLWPLCETVYSVDCRSLLRQNSIPTQRYIRIRQQSLVSKLHWLNKLWIVRNSFCDHRPWEYRSDSVYNTIGWNPDMCFFFSLRKKNKIENEKIIFVWNGFRHCYYIISVDRERCRPLPNESICRECGADGTQRVRIAIVEPN